MKFMKRSGSASPDGEVLAAKFCEWITECVKSADDEDCNILFNALDVLASISSEGDATKIATVIINCLNALPLPEKNLVFARRCAVVLRTYPNDSNKVKMDRFVSTASEPELLGLLYRLEDADVEISGSIWDEAAKLLATSRAADAKLSNFVVNQLAAGIRTRTMQSSSRFKWCIEKLGCAQPDASFLFSFCNGILARLEGQQAPIISKLLPLWIYAVMAHSTSRELDTKGFTSMIWDHIVRMLDKINQPITTDLSPGNSEAFVSRLFEVLGTTTSFAVVRPLIEDAVPSKLAYQVVALLKSEDEEVQERVIRICCEMLRQIGPMLLKIAEEEAPRTGLNRTAFIVITQAVVSKIVKGSLNHDFLIQVIPTCMAAIARLPYRMFIYSRIKDFLLKFASEETLLRRMLDELASPECSAYYRQLTKDSDERIKKLVK
ncbi:unnamed protein product [Cylicocyclus nassatus]|uniref:Uncharacterized protein n=1 Tax=Cylicocyclus nassatus TaxID=53992 RepID=A0AA36GJQ8_CYLNA|nr:unnamed protein product [Cylicocyclus nassatus]